MSSSRDALSNFRGQGWDPRLARRLRGPGERRARRSCANASHRDPRDDQLVRGPHRRWERRRVEVGEGPLGLVKAPDQQQAPDAEIARVRGVDAITVCLERLPCGVERLRRPAQVARGEGDLRLGDDASRASHRLLRAERAGRTPHERPRSREIAELRQRDAAQRQRRRVVAQGDPLQRAEGITSGERPRRSRNQRVHRNPATLVTPTLRRPPLNLSHGDG